MVRIAREHAELIQRLRAAILLRSQLNSISRNRRERDWFRDG